MTRADGTAARMRCSMTFGRGGDLEHLLVGGEAELRGDEQFVGAEVEGLHVDDALGLGAGHRSPATILLEVVVVGALAHEQALGLDAEHDGDDDRAACRS